MKTKATILFTFLLLTISLTSTAQQKSSRTARRAERLEQQQIQQQKLLSAIAAKNINFTANQITYTLNPRIQNIMLNQYYGITIEPDKIVVDLPLYGANNFNGMATLMRKLYFVAYKYNYSVEPLKDGGCIITIKVLDTWNMNNYIFVLTSTPSGAGTTLNSSTPFTAPVNYMGRLQVN